jgi:hypothetical protein
MSFLTDLATHIKTWANGKFSTTSHNHTGTYEPANANIQSHISNTSNPHATTKTHIGLSNVTNDAQMKKLASSTSGNVPTFANTTGDLLASGYSVETSSLVGSSSALARADVIKAAIDSVTAGMSSGLASPVADLTAIKATNTTDAGNWPDKVMMLVETLGLYRLDRESSAAGDDNLIIQPTTGVGRWYKMSSITTDHGLLSGIQGGITGERYHVTLSISNALAGTQGTPSGSNKFVTASDGKLARIATDGDFPVTYIDVEAAEWTAFDNALSA